MIEILTKIRAKITIIVIENREPYILLLLVNVKKSHYPHFLNPSAPTEIQEGEMMTPGTPCSSVRHFDCTGRRR